MTPKEAEIVVKTVETMQMIGMAVAAHLTEASRLLQRAAELLDDTGNALAALAPAAPTAKPPAVSDPPLSAAP